MENSEALWNPRKAGETCADLLQKVLQRRKLHHQIHSKIQHLTKMRHVSFSHQLIDCAMENMTNQQQTGTIRQWRLNYFKIIQLKTT